MEQGVSEIIACEIGNELRGPVCHLPISVSAQDLRALDTDKEKMDKSSPRGVLEDCMSGFDFERSSPKASTSDDEAQPNTKATSNWRTFFSVLKSRSMRRLASIPPVRVPKCSRSSSRSMRENTVSILNNPGADFCFKSSWTNFTLAELQNATNNFNCDNVIGRGGYAEVYMGCLEDGLYVAVKKLNRGTPEDRTGDFLSELGIIVHTDHPNIAKLIGYGIEGGMHLVFQLSPQGNLSSLLHDFSAQMFAEHVPAYNTKMDEFILSLIQVVQLLRGDETSLERVKRFRKPFLQRTFSEELYDAEEYNSTRNLNDLNRHRQVAFEFE
ncbi:hypothetical protein IFM89_000917 [Coptis chinensis]|uniref:Protein kinase domain-containing protein n=1 Tax=Coptis chinensis TaxID=261450 RepID=A0A835IKU2_9MAGN|nr:hypothetical protein IFM89_000917 [Coptis chinensis]